MRQLYILSLVFLTACPSLQTRTDIRSAGGRLQTPADMNAGKQATKIPAKAEQAASLEESQAEVRQLNGRVEELTYKLQEIEAKSAQQQEAELKIKDLESKVASLNDTILNLEGQLQNRPANSATTKVETANKKDLGPFEKGDLLFSKSDWKAAILEYNRYRDNFPKGRNYSEATYKIGIAFQELGMRDEARAFYSEVVDKFPKSKSAKSAKFRLNQLKK